MQKVKNELQNIVFWDGPAGQSSQIKKIQHFLSSNAETGFRIEKQQQLKVEETTALLTFAKQNDLLYAGTILENDFISEGAEQRVYRFDGTHVIKVNAGVFYQNWLEYFNSLLIHNYFFPATAYTFLGLND